MSSTSTSSAAAGALLRRQLKQMQTSKDIPGISCGLVSDTNIFEWEVMLMISDDVKYYGGKHPRPAPPLHGHNQEAGSGSSNKNIMTQLPK